MSDCKLWSNTSTSSARKLSEHDRGIYQLILDSEKENWFDLKMALAGSDRALRMKLMEKLLAITEIRFRAMTDE